MGRTEPEADQTSRLVGCSSEPIVAALDGEIRVRSREPLGFETLKADPALDTERRAQIIEAVRGGKHIALDVRARTFGQKDGVPNAKFLRFKKTKLSTVAATFKGQPFIIDHNLHDQPSRMGTILESEALDENAQGWTWFSMVLHVVKPHGVISVLDGTLDRFSIAWGHDGAAVFCTVHRKDIRAAGSCACWPGDVVMVDGGPQIVEYEFQGGRGKEASGTGGPAVLGTRIEDVRAALSAELSLPTDRKAPPPMDWTRLLAALGVTGLTALSTSADADRAAAAVEQLRRDVTAANQERDTARAQVTTLAGQLAAARVDGTKGQIDAIVAGAIAAGKIKVERDPAGNEIPSVREGIIRKAGELSVDHARREAAGLDVIVKLGVQPLADAADPAKTDPANPTNPAADPRPLKERDPMLYAELDNIAGQLAAAQGTAKDPILAQMIEGR